MTSPQARILIADDVPDVVQLLRDALIEQGYEVQTATTGIEALNAVVTFQPDVLLLDMQMPGLSGMKVLDELPVRDSSPSSRSPSTWTPSGVPSRMQ
jgi:CheY-like chemotaxis protein